MKTIPPRHPMSPRQVEPARPWTVAGRKVTVVRRPADSLHGRFGGGWQWHLGVQATASLDSIVVSLLTFYIRIDR